MSFAVPFGTGRGHIPRYWVLTVFVSTVKEKGRAEALPCSIAVGYGMNTVSMPEKNGVYVCFSVELYLSFSQQSPTLNEGLR